MKLNKSKLARHLKLPVPTVQNWFYRNSVPAIYCLAIEQYSNGELSRYELRPDVFGTSPHIPKDCFISQSELQAYFDEIKVPSDTPSIKHRGISYYLFSHLTHTINPHNQTHHDAITTN